MQPRDRVRAGTLGDVDVLVAFNLAMARETEDKPLSEPTLRAGVRGLIEDDSRGRYWVLEREGEVVASLMITTEWSDWRNGEMWWIQSVYVRPDSRRQGCYRRLYEHVLHEARARGDVRAVRLYVEKDNVVAQRTYAALGMQETAYRIFEWEPPPE